MVLVLANDLLLALVLNVWLVVNLRLVLGRIGPIHVPWGFEPLLINNCGLLLNNISLLILANLLAFGTLWLGKFFVLETILFNQRD